MRALVGVAAALLAGALPGAPVTRSDPGAEVPRTVTWAGREFSTSTELAAWLRARGLSYARWAANHPGAAARLERLAPESSGPTAEGPSATPEVQAAETEAHARSAGDSTPVSLKPILVIALLSLSGLLLLAAATPPQLLAHLRAPGLVHDRRPELATAGAALALAVGVALVL